MSLKVQWVSLTTERGAHVGTALQINADLEGIKLLEAALLLLKGGAGKIEIKAQEGSELHLLREPP